MRNRFDRELELLNTDLIEMGGLIESAIDQAVNALFDHFYSFAFHGIIGIVIAATVMIIPFSSFWNGATALPNVICLMVGVVAAVLLDRFNSSVTVE